VEVEQGERMPRPVHFELPVGDPDRAAAFYQKVFGWETQKWEGGSYWLVTSGPDSEPGINGAFGQKSDDFSVPVFVVEVPDMDDAISQVTEAGATRVLEKNSIPGLGYSSYFTDPEGNRIGLFQPDESVTA
jgi:predicted enzyme related to lactoylglutathione lyase